MKTNSALLLTSTQHDLLHPEGRAWGLVRDTVTKHRVVANLAALAAAARRAGVPVLHSPVGIDYAALDPATFTPVSVIQNLIVENRLFARGSIGAGFLAELAPQPGDIVLPPRAGFSSFWANDIDARLRALGVRTLHIAGMLAHACVESHARDAAERGYRVVVVRDAIGAAGEELLQAACAILELHAHALLTTKETVAQWANPAAASVEAVSSNR